MQPFSPLNSRAPFIWHGGDYNPEQWPRAIWDEDIQLMQECHFEVATLGVFSWVSLQPEEERFTFEGLDTILDKLAAAGRFVCLATPTAAQPAWMSQRYPDVMRAGDNGVRWHHSWRVNYCPCSANYRRLAVQIAGKLAERYHQHPAVIAWHVSNEYAGACYCENCAAAFRTWLQQRYANLDVLNQRWWAAFWSHTYTDWSQIEPPYANGERSNHALVVDYKRFQSEMMLECYKTERDAIRAYSQHLPITTNMMNTYSELDYRAWAKEVDVISWDCYPSAHDQASDIAFAHDFMRGLRDGQPFMLMEQTPSSQNWQEYNSLKRPGVLRLWSYLAVAHGAETVMYFQWRRSRGQCEKMHGAIIEHSGRSDTRVFREVRQLGEELLRLQDRTLGGVTPSEVALIFDWNNWWAMDASIGPVRDKRYVATVRQHYATFWKRNVPVDIVFSDSDFSRYRVLIAPMLYMLKPGVAERIRDFVRQGGTFVTTYFSGMVDECDLAFENGYPGPLREVLGIWNEEIDALHPDQHNRIVLHDSGESYTCGHLCAITHCEGATTLATYGDDFYAGTPVLTRHNIGAGAAYYIGSEPESRFLDDFYGRILQEQQIHPVLTTPPGVEATLRQNAQGQLLFLLNHQDTPTRVALPPGNRYHDLLRDQEVAETLLLEAYDVAILTKA
ncbi:beta-galactosidase [Ktedonobacter robiniae]|uniref:Beta-galactosidase n=1 Tax=Ktedonobacter robiniae TaxID=2778365 RepID=A0ABQ3V3F0_9CHLR|nr:beta-galactosidase [Ktedonobacter robiniae]GHO59699.1 beta-galactosidase [Ktedonobacter robiniae]